MSKDTKTIIMDVAEALFAEHGYEATSLRTITQKANVNLASVNYHFGGKETLLEAIYSRRIDPMNEERLKKLAELEAEYSGNRVPVAKLVRAFVAPALALSRGNNTASFIALLGRSYLEPSPVLQDKVRHMFDGVTERFKAQFIVALPEVPQEELYWRLHFMVGVLAYCMAGTEMMRMIASSRMAEKNGSEQLIERLVTFVSHGLVAPVELGPDYGGAS